jgi:hypothetical protein
MKTLTTKGKILVKKMMMAAVVVMMGMLMEPKLVLKK